MNTHSTIYAHLFSSSLSTGGDQMTSPIFDVPIDIPTPVAMTSDPHFKGLRGQEFDFTGEPGKIYAILSDHGLALNALFAKGYTTGMALLALVFFSVLGP